MTTEIISILANLSGAVATCLIFIWYLKYKSDKDESIDRENLKNRIQLTKTLQKLTDVTNKQNGTIVELGKSIANLQNMIENMYLHQKDQARVIDFYEKKLKDCEEKKK